MLGVLVSVACMAPSLIPGSSGMFEAIAYTGMTVFPIVVTAVDLRRSFAIGLASAQSRLPAEVVV